MATNNNQYTKEQNPWYSFRPYQESDVDKFKGRGRDIAEVMKYILGNDFVVCYAKSGIGKSSLINAGLMPRLRKKQILPISIKFTEEFFAEDSFERNIRTQIVSEIDKLNDKAKEEGRDDIYSFIKHPSIDGSPAMKAADIELADNSIWWWLSTYQLICRRGEFDIVYQPILIFDQFEELFQKTQTDEQRKAFFGWLQRMSLSRPSEDIQIKLQQIQNFYPDTSVSIPNNCGWKILLSLREDYVGLLDYWCIQRIRIPAIQNNRYCLMPLTREQAEEVVMQQTIDGHRVDILDKYKQIIIDSLMEADGIPAVLLSVLCNRLFNEEVSGYASTAHKLNFLSTISENEDNDNLKKVIRALIRSVYEERVKEANVSKRLVNSVEQALVRDNGTRKRPELSELSKRQQVTCFQLANVYLIRIDDFGVKNGEKVRYVEIIHDRVAEVIAEKRYELNKKTRVFWSRVALVIGFILLFGFTYWNQFWTSDKYKAELYPYMEFRDASVKETASHFKGACNNLWSLDTLICDTSVTISNCPSLEIVDASNSKANFLKIIAHNCDQLKYLILNNNIEYLVLNITGCPQVQQIELPENLSFLDLNVISDRLSFKVHDNSRFCWSDGVLWDKQSDTILYIRSDVALRDIIVPYATNKKTYSYRPLTLKVLNTDTIELPSYSLSLGKEYIRRIARDVEELDFLDDSLIYIPSELFCNLKNLKIIKFPSSLEIIYPNAFENCTNLSQIFFNDSSSIAISSGAFANCKNLKAIRFPREVALEMRAFENCSSIEEIYFGENAAISDYSFKGCSSLKKVKLPSSIHTSYGEAFSPNAFVGCLNIEKLDGDTAYWSYLPDSSVIYNLDHYIILTNRVKYHTYEDSIFSSKDGALYLHNQMFNMPLELSRGQTCVRNNGILLINNKDNPNSIYLPLDVGIRKKGGDFIRTFPEFLISPSNLKKLHYPYSSMVDASGMISLLSDSIRENVTLFVPYGCLKYFSNNDEFENFKEIREEKWYVWGAMIFLHHLESGLSVVNYYDFLGLIIAIIIISTIMLSWYVYFRKLRMEGVVSRHALIMIIAKSFATVILGPCFWYITYWFIYLAIIPLLHLNLYLYSSPWLFMPCAIIAGVVALFAVYMVLYSDGFNLKGLGTAIKENAKTLKWILVSLAKQPKKVVKPLSLSLLPLLSYFSYLGYKEYKEQQLVKASIKINEKVSLAKSHPEDALNILYDVWEETRSIIRGEDPEQVLFNAVYGELLSKNILDTCFSDIRATYMAEMPDNKLLFADYWNDKTVVLQENSDTLHLLEDDYDWYKIDALGRYVTYGHNYGTYVMDLNTRQIDTLKDVGRAATYMGQKNIISYRCEEGRNIRFYDVEKKHNNVFRPILLNHYINGFCYSEYDKCLATVAYGDTILFHKLEKNQWHTDTIATKVGSELKNPTFIGNGKFTIQIDDTLKSWPANHIGDKEYQQYWVIGLNKIDAPFLYNGEFYAKVWHNVLTIYDMAETEKVYLTIEFSNNICSACIAQDGEKIYIADGRYIFRIPIMSHDQVFEKLKQIVSN